MKIDNFDQFLLIIVFNTRFDIYVKISINKISFSHKRLYTYET